jgi:hypothetical protein
MKEQDLGLNSKFAPAVFPADIMYDENLDSTERWILAILFTYTNAHTNTAFPSYQTIADRSGFSRRTCITTAKRLIEKRYIVKKEVYQKSKDGNINQTSNEYTLYFKSRGSESPSLGGSESPSLGVVTQLHPNYPIELSIEEEEEQTGNIPKRYIEMALKIGASKADLEVALKKMDLEPDIKSPVAWLQKALGNEVMNRELASRPKAKRDLKPSTKPHAVKQQKTDPNKYEKFYL